jgi:hypothetical protein
MSFPGSLLWRILRVAENRGIIQSILAGIDQSGGHGRATL